MTKSDAPQHSKSTAENPFPFLSVIVPVRCEREGLGLLLPDLMSQDYPKSCWELIIADGESTDGTTQFIRDFALTAEVPITLVRNRGIRSSAGRNAGISVASGELVVFIDGHCRVPNRSLLTDTVSLFRETGADCLCRPQPLKGTQGSLLSHYIAEARRSSFGHGRGSMIYDMQFTGFTDPTSSGASYRRSIFDQVGLYDESFDACEDVELNTRVRDSGMQAYSDPKLAIEYDARQSLPALAKQMIRYGRGRVRLALKHPSERRLSSVAPLLLCLSVTGPLFPWRNNLLLAGASVPILLYLFAVIAATAQLMVRTRQIQASCALAIYPVIHFGLGIGMFWETATLCRRVPLQWIFRQRLA